MEAISYPFSRNLIQVNRICGKFKTSFTGIWILMFLFDVLACCSLCIIDIQRYNHHNQSTIY
jgi:hypothetical protein